ncbi:hypothetical protein JWZ98_20595 [Methylomonas sp. EFPC1]|uniref:hypothetical protein n=1 Tax=Methylomonas sp. EFPC1 TaxID=2812647 RepID=UPI00196760B0|nr:hypothetical protein [Methylomonas sp. EFPC1]QSB01012.1 hypothetical protein JWZ98_20595 [Methylomonas sp. EFPC1]
MIAYKYPEEKEILMHYAHKLQANGIIEIIDKGYVKNAHEAKLLTAFFWQMVDESVKDAEQGFDAAGHRDLQAYDEYIMNTLRSYLVNAGYEKEWSDDDESA